MKFKKNIYVLVQVRTSSSRLFGKCIFYIKNKELILLLYKRIKSKKYKTILLTSKNKSDDYLSNLLKKNNISFYRGNLNNVRKRFIDFTSDLNENDIIVRCTADNLFIDSNLINYLLKKFNKSKKSYLKIDREESLLPYGMSVEIFSVGGLRKIKSKNKFDDEHLTPPFIRNKKNIDNVKIKYKYNLYDKRCTIDTLKDYITIKYIFENFNNNFKTKWQKLCNDLYKLDDNIINNEILKKKNLIEDGKKLFGFQFKVNDKFNTIKHKEITSIIDYAKKIK